MEVRTTCPSNDLVCIAEDLLARWERFEQPSFEPEPELLSPATDECLPCVLEDLKSGFED